MYYSSNNDVISGYIIDHVVFVTQRKAGRRWGVRVGIGIVGRRRGLSRVEKIEARWAPRVFSQDPVPVPVPVPVRSGRPRPRVAISALGWQRVAIAIA